MVVGASVADAEEPACVLGYEERKGMPVNGKVRRDDLEHPAEGCCGDV